MGLIYRCVACFLKLAGKKRFYCSAFSYFYNSEVCFFLSLVRFVNMGLSFSSKGGMDLQIEDIL